METIKPFLYLILHQWKNCILHYYFLNAFYVKNMSDFRKHTILNTFTIQQHILPSKMTKVLIPSSHKNCNPIGVITGAIYH